MRSFPLRKENLLPVGILVVSLFVSAHIVFAQEPPPSPLNAIQYPVAELGDCKSASECHTYCDDYKNLDACASFAKEHNILTDAEIEKAKKFDDTLNQAIAAGGGPGACKTMDECQSYCEIESNIPTCLKFVEEFNLLPFDKLEELKHVSTGIAVGGKLPGDCRGRENCFAYCESSAHMEECITFGEQAGFISPGEADQARKVMPYMVRGETPGKCTRKNQCDVYCSKPNHAEECIAFAEKAGLIKGMELEQAKKIVPFLARGETPGGCTSKETCDTYCRDESHSEECISFAEKAGLMTKDEAEMIRKTGGKGPGGCHSKETCEAFCNDPANQQTCMDFAKEHGMGNAQFEQKKAAIMQEMQNCVAISSCGGFMSCMQGLQAKYGGGQRQQEGQAGLPAEVQVKMNTCISEMQKGGGSGGQGGPPSGGGGNFSGGQPPANYSGPGGCTSQTDCAQYCSDPSHHTECAQFVPPTSSSGSGAPTTSSQQQYQVDCSTFSSVPSCSYITDPQGNSLCKQCFPNK